MLEQTTEVVTFPASSSQRRLWLLDRIDPGSPAYNVPTATRLRGRLDVDSLSRSLSEVVSRHETLRTTFGSRGGSPVQLIHPPSPVPLPVVDLSGHGDAESEARRLTSEEAAAPFDLSEGPLLRARLLRLSGEEHVLLLTLHHVVTDGWSTGVLFRELAALYSSYARGEESPLEELPIQYADYAAWQEEQSEGEGAARQLDYWRERLGGASGVLELPADRPRPARPSGHGSKSSIQIDAEVTAGLRALGLCEGATPFMTLLAAFQSFLYRYTGQADVSVGTPIANRAQAEVQGLIGFFVNTLVMRERVEGGEGFRGLLRRARVGCVGAYANQEVPFERLVEELQPERDQSRTPLFQVMFLLTSGRRDVLTLEGLESEEIEPVCTTSKFDVLLGARDEGDRIVLDLSYNTDLFDAPTVDRMLSNFKTMLGGIVADPDGVIDELPLLGEDERRRLLVGWNDTGRDFPAPRPFHQHFESEVERSADRVALVCGERRLSYSELNGRANQVAHHLRSLGVGPESVVGVMMERSAELVVAMLGVLKAGAAYVPLDPTYPKDRLAFMLEDARAHALLTQQSLRGTLPAASSTRVVCIDSDWAEIETRPACNVESGVTAENLAYLIYTSGSTGRPKGVAIKHSSADTFIHWAREVFTTEDLDGVLAATSVCFDLSIFELFVPISWGGKVILAENALHLPTIPAAGEVRLVNTVPSAMTELVRVGGVPASVRTVNLAGEPLQRALVQSIYDLGTVERVLNLYGPSEDTTYSTFVTVPRNSATAPTIGRPVANTQVYILDRLMRPQPAGVHGELYIGGDGLARGYLGRPELTAEKFVPDPFSNAPGARLYRTGDRARYLADGQIEFLGRLDYQVKIRGFRIELGEIETSLGTHERVRQCLVVVREEEDGDRRLVAYVVTDGSVGTEELREHIRRGLPEYMVPSAFVHLDEFPLTPNGKIDRKSLPAPASAEESDGYVAPRTETEREAAEVWGQVLRVGRVGSDDNFFALGGHSLLGMQLISRVREVFGVELPLHVLFGAPVLSEFAASIDKAKEQRGVGASPIIRRAARRAATA